MHEVFEHTADIGLRVQSTNLEGLFREAAEGLFELIATRLDENRGEESLSFSLTCHEGNYGDLMFDWLNELLFTSDVRRLLLSDFNVQLTTDRLTASARGERLDANRLRLDHEIKAITYHGLKVVHTETGWLAEVIVDI